MSDEVIGGRDSADPTRNPGAAEGVLAVQPWRRIDPFLFGTVAYRQMLFLAAAGLPRVPLVLTTREHYEELAEKARRADQYETTQQAVKRG